MGVETGKGGRGPNYSTSSMPGVCKLFCVKGQIINVFGFLEHLVSVAVTQLCCCENSHRETKRQGESEMISCKS